MSDVYIASGLRSPFSKVDDALAAYDAVALSVPVAQAMVARLKSNMRPDFVVWGSVVPNLGWSNIAREIWLDAELDPTVPAYSFSSLYWSQQPSRNLSIHTAPDAKRRRRPWSSLACLSHLRGTCWAEEFLPLRVERPVPNVFGAHSLEAMRRKRGHHRTGVIEGIARPWGEQDSRTTVPSGHDDRDWRPNRLTYRTIAHVPKASSK